MQLLSVGPLEAGAVAWITGAGDEVLTVACKIAFHLAPGACRLAEPEPVAGAAAGDALPASRAAPSPADLARPSDLDPAKPRADVLLVGSAYAPRGAPVRSLVARLAVGGPGGVDKRIEVHGDRVQHPGNAVEARTFVRMPLSYARAAGGPGTPNPFGVPVDPPAGSEAPRPLPNLVPAGPRPEGARGEPAGFGPLPPGYPTRAAKVRLPSERLAGWRERPLPPEVDPTFFQAAPADQQVASLDPGAPLVLESLHPDHASLSTRLPGLVPQLFVEPRSAPPEEIALRPDTLWLDTDRCLGTLTFRAVLRRPPADARLVVVLDESGRRLSLVEALGRAAAGARAATLELSSDARQPPDPGRSHAGALPREVREVREAREAREAGEGRPVARRGEAPRMTAPAQGGSDAPVLPFQAALGVDLRQGPQGQRETPGSGVSEGAAKGVTTAPGLPAETASTPSRPAVELLFSDPAPWAASRLRRLAAEIPPGPAGDAESDEAEALVDEGGEGGLDAGRGPGAERRLQAMGAARRQVASILAGATPSTFEGLRATLTAAVRRGGRFVPPLVVVEGKLHPELDPLAVLRAAIAVARATPEGRPGALGELLEWASAWASAPEAASARAAARGVLARLADGFGAATRGLPAGHLEAEAHRAALEAGAFERRAALGTTCVRARLELAAGEPEQSVMAYLPAPGEDALPRFEALTVRALGELRAPLEQDAAPPLSLRVIGIGRVLG